MIQTDVTLSGLKGELDQINHQLNHIDTRRADGVEYKRPLTDSTGTVRFSRMMLKNEDYVRTMFSICDQYSTKGPVELDASLVRYVEEIQQKFNLAQELRRD